MVVPLPFQTQGKTLTIDFLEHPEHALEKVVVEKPHGRVLEVLFERHCEAVGDVDLISCPRAEEDPHNSVPRV